MVPWWWLPVVFVAGMAVPIAISWAAVLLSDWPMYVKRDYPH